MSAHDTSTKGQRLHHKTTIDLLLLDVSFVENGVRDKYSFGRTRRLLAVCGKLKTPPELHIQTPT